MASVKKKKLTSTKRFGPRYGKRIKARLESVESLQRKKYKCPYCNYLRVKRKSAGIWYCSKCEATFTSRAYTIKTPKIKEVVSEELELPEEPEESDEEEEAEAVETPATPSEFEKPKKLK